MSARRRTIGLRERPKDEFLDELRYMAKDPERAHIRPQLLHLIENIERYETIYSGDVKAFVRGECAGQALAVLHDLEHSNRDCGGPTR